MSTLGIIASSHKFKEEGVLLNLTISSNTNNYNFQTERGGKYDPGITDEQYKYTLGILEVLPLLFTPA